MSRGDIYSTNTKKYLQKKTYFETGITSFFMTKVNSNFKFKSRFWGFLINSLVFFSTIWKKCSHKWAALKQWTLLFAILCFTNLFGNLCSFWISQKWAALYSSGPSWLPFCALQSWLKALIVTDKPSRKFLDANSHVHAFNHWVVTLKKTSSWIEKSDPDQGKSLTSWLFRCQKDQNFLQGAM